MDRSFYEAWLKEPVDGLKSCLARLLAVVGRPGSIRDPHLVYQALEEAAREVYRRRYVYRDVSSFGEFSRLVVTSAVYRYRGQHRPNRYGPSERLVSDPPDPRPAGGDGLEMEERRAALEGCLNDLPEGPRIVIVLRYMEDRAFREIADRVGMTEGAARVAHLRALRNLSRCMNSKGFGPEDITLLH